MYTNNSCTRALVARHGINSGAATKSPWTRIHQLYLIGDPGDIDVHGCCLALELMFVHSEGSQCLLQLSQLLLHSDNLLLQLRTRALELVLQLSQGFEMILTV